MFHEYINLMQFSYYYDIITLNQLAIARALATMPELIRIRPRDTTTQQCTVFYFYVQG